MVCKSMLAALRPTRPGSSLSARFPVVSVFHTLSVTPLLTLTFKSCRNIAIHFATKIRNDTDTLRTGILWQICGTNQKSLSTLQPAR